MLSRLLDFVIGREPVATATGIAAVITALAGALTAFDIIELSGEQIAALGALAAAVAGWLGRKAVTPVTDPAARAVARRLSDTQSTHTVAGDSRIRGEDGGVPLALIIMLVVGILVLAGFFGACDALINDEDEEGDLGLPFSPASQVYRPAPS